MKVGIVVYPGSNCDKDTLLYFPNATYIWHKNNKLLKDIDLLVLPGGFAFGDRYYTCLLYTSPSPRDYAASRMPSSA